MDIIPQTNRTILFEEFNRQKLDLLTLIGDVKGIESLNDEQIREINEQLLVKNFDEFLEKFPSIVYSFFDATNQTVIYTLEKPENIPEDCISEIHLDQNNDFLKMLITLIDTKRSQGIRNVDFKFEKVLDMISPKKIMDDIKQVRKEIHHLYHKYETLEEGDPVKLDLADKLNYKFEEASQNYNNVLAMLPLAIEDIKTRLLYGKSQADQKKANNIKIGMLTMGEHGELKIIEAPHNENSTDLMLMEDQRNTNLVSVFEEDYQAISENPSDYVKDLVVRTFCPLPATSTEIDVAREVENYNYYLEFYKSAKDDFVKAAKPLIENILGVKMFFDQYATKGRGMHPSLLVTNCKLDIMLKSNNVPKFEMYLNTVNNKNDFLDTIWFGIVPAIEIEPVVQLQIRRERFKGNEKFDMEPGNTIESLSMLLQILEKYKIQVFFNFQASDETTFNSMATTGIERFMEKCEVLARQSYSEFAVPCMPNFTIIPREKSGVVIDAKMLHTEEGVRLSKEKEDILKLWIEGVYVDAAYVAAGLVAAYQCPAYLREYFKNVHKGLPGVRFDLESADNNFRVITTMGKEITGFTNRIKDLINKSNFGFIFSSENASFKGKDIKRITVYKARTLAVTENEGYEPLYKTLVSTFVERILRYDSSDFKQDKIIKFFSNHPESQKRKWVEASGFVNSIIQPGDDIGFTIDEMENLCYINLTFNGSTKNLEVTITKNTIAAATSKAS
ncbi:MAG TPA: transcriptional regulator [Firmicutes bacterium]|nr:transcriptional regulator [Bacillota bacterium]